MRAIFTNWLYILTGILLVGFREESTAATDLSDDSRLMFVFNQPAYASGDTAFFSGYLLHGNDRMIRNKQVVGIKLFGVSNELIYHGRVLFQDGTGVSQIVIPENLEPGNYQFVAWIESGNQAKGSGVYTSWLRISSSEIVHAEDRHMDYLSEDTSKLMIRTDRDKYGRRSKVSVSVTPSVNISNSSLSALSIAVFNEQLFLDSSSHKVSTVVLPVRSDSDASDSGMSSNSFDFPEYFSGKAFIKSSGMAVPDSSKITFYLNESDFAYVVHTSSGGNFSFPLFKNFGNEEVFYRIYYKGALLSDSHIVIADANVENTESRRNEANIPYGLYARQKRIINTSYHYFASKGNKDANENRYESDVEADSEIRLEKFDSFTSMAEVFSNIIPSVRYRKTDGVDRIRIFMQQTTGYGARDPLYIVNGIMTDNTQFVLSLDPGFVRKISVLRSERTLTRFGELGLDGILLIETTIPDITGLVINSGTSLSVVGIGKSIEYRKVMYSQGKLNSRTPDLRSSLYWNPKADSKSMSSFDFYTCDDIGYYIIQIAGIMDGQPFLSTKRFYVAPGVD